MKKLITLAVSLLISFSANATSDLNRSITSIGVQGVMAYLVLNPAPTNASCAYGLVYLNGSSDLSTSSGKALYATLLSAYSQGKVLERVDYAPDATVGMCVISLIQVGQ